MSPEANPRDLGVLDKGVGAESRQRSEQGQGQPARAHTSALRLTSSSMALGLTSPCLSFFICTMGLIKAEGYYED